MFCNLCGDVDLISAFFSGGFNRECPECGAAGYVVSVDDDDHEDSINTYAPTEEDPPSDQEEYDESLYSSSVCDDSSSCGSSERSLDSSGDNFPLIPISLALVALIAFFIPKDQYPENTNVTIASPVVSDQIPSAAPPQSDPVYVLQNTLPGTYNMGQNQSNVQPSGSEAENNAVPPTSDQSSPVSTLQAQPDTSVGEQAPSAATTTMPADGYTDPFEYCRTMVNANGGEGGINDNRYTGKEPPDAVVNAMMEALHTKSGGSYTWRCMGGEVYGCSLGASGRACRIAETSEQQISAIAQFCATNPDSTFVPNAVNYSASDWSCNGNVPVIVTSYLVDENGYIKDNWVKVEH